MTGDNCIYSQIYRSCFYSCGTNYQKVCRIIFRGEAGNKEGKWKQICTWHKENGENANVFAVYIHDSPRRVSRRILRLASKSADSTNMPSIRSSVKVPSAGIR